MSTTMDWLFCTRCRGRREFEQPPCADGHGPDCPDLACVECGLAVFAFADRDAGAASGASRHRRVAGPRAS